MNQRVFDQSENALTVLSRIPFNELIDCIARRTTQLLETESSAESPLYVNFLTAKEVALRLGVSPRKLDSLIDQGKVPPPVLGGGQGSKRLWNPRDLDTLRSAS